MWEELRNCIRNDDSKNTDLKNHKVNKHRKLMDGQVIIVYFYLELVWIIRMLNNCG